MPLTALVKASFPSNSDISTVLRLSFQEAINECDSLPCLHDGRCFDLDADFRCECLPGWTGRTCEHIEGMCMPDTCRNGAPCFNVSRRSYCE